MMDSGEKEIEEKLRKWKDGMESKRLKVNMVKTKVMKTGEDGVNEEVVGKRK